MIFVSVGTTKFDALVKEIDKIAKNSDEKFIVQIGNGNYIPKNCGWFRFANSLNEYYSKADFIISQGGAATVFEILTLNKKLIGINNPLLSGNHQIEILSKLGSENYLIWCKNINELGILIKKAKSFKLKKYTSPKCEIHGKIIEFLKP